MRLVRNKCRKNTGSPAIGALLFPLTSVLMAVEYERTANSIRLRLAAGCITLRINWCLIHEPHVRIPEQLLRRKRHAMPDTCVTTCQAPWSKWAVCSVCLSPVVGVGKFGSLCANVMGFTCRWCGNLLRRPQIHIRWPPEHDTDLIVVT